MIRAALIGGMLLGALLGHVTAKTMGEMIHYNLEERQ